jgi:uncharacterized repeat protein (TIGR03803 family)
MPKMAGIVFVFCTAAVIASPAQTFTTLPGFDGMNSARPPASLVQGFDGNFYGTTFSGGGNVDGTVFSLSVGLGPFVETVPTSGKVGAAVIILGNNLTGTTSVIFNGTAAELRSCPVPKSRPPRRAARPPAKSK